MMNNIITSILTLISLFLLASCSSVNSIGEVGPKKLKVYSIAQNDFLAASRMLVIVDERGKVVAYTGGTVSGGGTVGLETAGTLTTAGAIAYGAKTVSHGMQKAARNANLNVNGIPGKESVDINIHGKIDK
jgi:hypothetical protein